MCIKQSNLYSMNLCLTSALWLTKYFLTLSSLDHQNNPLEYIKGDGKIKMQEGGNGYLLSTYFVPNTTGMWIYLLVTSDNQEGYMFSFSFTLWDSEILVTLAFVLQVITDKSRGWFPSLIPKRKYNFLYQYWH